MLFPVCYLINALTNILETATCILCCVPLKGCRWQFNLYIAGWLYP